MILDKLEQLSDAQAFTGSDEVTTNTRDLGNITPKRDIGPGEELGMLIAVTTAADATTGDETYAFRVIQSANDDLSSADVLAENTIPRASLTLGAVFIVPIPPGVITKRYIGGQALLGGTTPSVSADIFIGSMKELAVKAATYAKGYTV